MGMRERVQALQGEFELSSSAGGGLTVHARIPLEAAGAQASRSVESV
jgi:hypothetical protein